MLAFWLMGSSLLVRKVFVTNQLEVECRRVSVCDLSVKTREK